MFDKTQHLCCPGNNATILLVTRMHSSRMRTARSNSRWGVSTPPPPSRPPGAGTPRAGTPRCGPGDLSQSRHSPRCGPGDPLGCGPGDPLGVGVETPPGQTPQLPPWVWASKPTRHARIPPPPWRQECIPVGCVPPAAIAVGAGIPSL